MVDQGGLKRSYNLEEIFTEKCIQDIVHKHLKNAHDAKVIGCEATAAIEGLAGFLADHIRVLLKVKCGDKVEQIRLFVKRVPLGNKPKAEFIDGNKYFNRENLIFELLDEMKGAEGSHPWCTKSYVNTECLIAMPDLKHEGYVLHPLLRTLDLQHVLLTVTSIARFHAAFANYETNKSIGATRPYDFYREFGHILVEPTFKDSPWVRTSAKLTSDLIDAFSTKYRNIPGLEDKLAKLFVEACESLDVAEGSLNVVVHKDLWINNILYKYEDGEPTNALLIDYQCVRYGPPAFDLTSFLYLNTNRKFREKYESQVFKHYFDTFSDALEDAARKRLEGLGYDEKEFLEWCEKSRMFAVFDAAALFPIVLMDARSAERVFDDPRTFISINEQDRSEPVIEYAKKQPIYMERNLEASEEFVERYIIPRK